MDKFRNIWIYLASIALVLIGVTRDVNAAQLTRGYSEIAWDAQGKYFAISGPISP